MPRSTGIAAVRSTVLATGRATGRAQPRDRWEILCIVRAMPPAKKVVRKPARASAPPPRAAAKSLSQPPAARKGKSASGASAGNGRSRAEPARRGRTERDDVRLSDPTLFAPLTPGEVADALRTLTEDRRVANMAKVGRYRVIATEPLVVKPPHWIAGHRLARVVIYDYAADRCVDACVDLDAGVVAHLDVSKAQPMLSREEEAVAIQVAVADARIRDKLLLGEEAQVCMHYWGRDATDLSFSRRSAAVVFGRPGGDSTLVAVVDLLDNVVSAVIPAAQW